MPSESIERPLAVKGLLERGAEHHALVRTLGAVRGGHGSAVAVIGPAGVGKTALGGMTRSLAREAGLPVLRARGAELEQRFAFGVVRQLFERMVASASAEEREELFAEAAAGARAVLEPGLGGAPAPRGRVAVRAAARAVLVPRARRR